VPIAARERGVPAYGTCFALDAVLGNYPKECGFMIYAIGDVHGRADLLVELFAAIDADLADRPPAADILHVFLGDYIDRGPESRRTIDLVIARRRRHETVLLKGNHETFPAQFLSDPMFGDWRHLGGLETLMSYGLRPTIDANPQEQRALARQFAAALPESHARFFSELKNSFCCGDFFFVHAGVKPGVPLERQREEDMLWIREDFLHHEEDFGKIIVHGHTPVRESDFYDNRINIDTGAYATGKLTCPVMERDQLAVLNTIG
jgi:serine/threonine protein phosphatase 1